VSSPVQTSFLATPRGKLTLAFLCGIGFLDFIDASIVNVALPSIRHHLHFSVQNLQWVLSGYLLTYGGFMLLGGRAADLIGRRRVLMAGICLFGVSSLTAGLAQSEGMLIGARLVQGVGAAMMLPAALSTLTTRFTDGADRNTALGVWGGIAGLASGLGVTLGGLISEGPGWRWVFFVNLPLCVIDLFAASRLLERDHRAVQLKHFDARGAVLLTASMLLLVYTLVEAPLRGWGATRTIVGFAGAAVLLVLFAINEARHSNPVFPFSILRINGLAAADATQVVAIGGFYAMFFLLTLYMQNVLGYSQIQAGLAYVPTTLGVAVSAGVSSQLITRFGTRPVIVAGALIGAGGLFLLSGIPVHGSYLHDLLPGMMVMSIGLGAIFVGVTTAAQAGVPADKAGLAAALVNASTWIGGALGVAILTAVATTRANHLLEVHASPAAASTSGFERALLIACFFLIAAVAVGFAATQTRGEPAAEPPRDLMPASESA
jgi:EmrB/QacA subfamily drug resistance transporter